MKSLFLLAGIATAMAAAESPQTTAPLKARNDAERPKFVFSLLPRSMEKNPVLDMTAITEMTPVGKLLPVPSPENPQYYLATSGGFRSLGHVPVGDKNPFTEEQITEFLRKSLARNGYQPADAKHPATIALVYHWGAFPRHDSTNKDLLTETPEEIYRDLIDRARLVGGTKFAEELDAVMQRRFDVINAMPRERVDPTGSVPTIPSTAGQMGANLLGSFIDPVEQFMARDGGRTRFLTEQADANLYYVIASAFDAGQLAKGKKVLFWRTKMTVDSSGVSMAQTLPVLVASAAPYFGKEMDGPATIVQNVREGRIEYGEATVVSEEQPDTERNKPAKTGQTLRK